MLLFPEGTRTRTVSSCAQERTIRHCGGGRCGRGALPHLLRHPDGKMRLFCKVRVIFGEPMPAEQFAMESRRDTKKLRANKQALLDAWEKMGA